MQREKENSSQTKVKLLPDMSRDIFEQEEFLAHYARLLREGDMAWQQTGPVRDRKPLNAGQTKAVKQELSKLAPAS